MRYSVSTAIGIVVLLMVGGLCLSNDRAGTQDRANVSPASFELYTRHVLHAGDAIHLGSGASGGYSVMLLSKEQAKRQNATVKEVHSDYVVVQYEDAEGAIPFSSITQILKHTVKDPN